MTTVEPGSIDTGLRERRTRYLAEGSPYRLPYETFRRKLDLRQAKGSSPEEVAVTILKALSDRKPKPLYRSGREAVLVSPALRVAPESAIERIVARAVG